MPVAVATGGTALLVGLGVFVVRAGVGTSALAAPGYAGTFALMALAAVAPSPPAPGFAAVLAAGAGAHPFLVGVVAGRGSATGELAGHAAGRAGPGLLGPLRVHRRGTWLTQAPIRHGAPAFVPNLRPPAAPFGRSGRLPEADAARTIGAGTRVETQDGWHGKVGPARLDQTVDHVTHVVRKGARLGRNPIVPLERASACAPGCRPARSGGGSRRPGRGGGGSASPEPRGGHA